MFSAAAVATAQTISVNGEAPPAAVSVGAATSLTLEVIDGPGNLTDWVALYPAGAPDAGYLSWSYLSGSATPPASGLMSASFTTYAPLAAGTYEWRLFANNGWTRLATSSEVTVSASLAAMTVNGVALPAEASVGAGSQVTVMFVNGPGNPTDWIGLAPAGSPDTTLVDWRYLNSTTVPPSTGLTNGTVQFLAPATAGSYELRFFAHNTFDRVAMTPFSVLTSLAALTVNDTAPPTAVPVAAGTYVNVGVTDGPAQPDDWVGLFAVNAPDSANLAWKYMNGSATIPSSGLSGATLSFAVPVSPGTYEFRFFNAGTFTRLATSTTMVVSASTSALSVNGVSAPGTATAAAGSQAVIGVAGGPGNTGDWVGLYRLGESDSAILDWRYLSDTAQLPSTGISTATLHFGVPTTPGTYEMRFFTDGSYNRLAMSGPVVVPETVAQISINGVAPPTSVNVEPGATVSVGIAGGPANPTDWVALAVAGSPDSTYSAWQYLNGSTAVPTAGLASATLSFVLPSTAGTYEVRLFAHNSYQRITTSAPVVASNQPASVSITLTSPFPGTTFNAPSSLPLSASASITGGTISRVDFYAGTTLVGSASAAPYQVSWVTPSEGVYVLTAAAIDSTNRVTTSVPIPITIAAPGSGEGTLGAPIVSPPGGSFSQPPLVTLIAESSATIRYTLDGSLPTAASELYTTPLSIQVDNTTLRARAFRANWTTSEASSDVYRLDTAAPSITARQFPGPFQGWQLTPVTISFTCTDNMAVASCPVPVVVSTEGAGQIIGGTVIDTAGNQALVSQTLNLDFTPPLVSLTSPTESVSTTDSSIVLSSAVADSVSGIGGVKCNGVVATVAAGQATCTVPLRPGRNDIAVVARDAAGNVRSAGISVLRTGTSTALTLSPMKQTVLVDEGVILTLNDNFGTDIHGATWASDDSAIVSVSTDDPPVLTGVAPGVATITVTKNGLSAEATVTVIAGATFPDGVARWILDGSPGFEYWGVINTNRVDPSVPEMFTLELGTDWLVRGVSATGRAQSVIPAPGYVLMGDSFGGLVSWTGGNAFSSLYGSDNRYTGFARFAGPAEAPPWRYESRDSLGTPAQAPDGTIYMLEKVRVGTNTFQRLPIIETQLVAMDGATGLVKSRYTLDRERRNIVSFGNFQCAANYEAIPETAGPIVGNDGSGYLLVRTQSQVRLQNCPNVLASQDVGVKLLRMSPDGEISSTTIYSHHCNRGSIDPEVCDEPPQLRDLIPDGAGGVLARVTYTTSAVFDWIHGANYTYETRVSRITPAGVQYTNNLNLYDYFSPMMAGDDGTALVFTNAAWHLKDVTNWSTLWSNPNTRLQPVTATLERGTAMLDIDSGDLIHFNATGAIENSAPFGGTWGYQSGFGLWTSSEWGLTARFSTPLYESTANFGGLSTGQNAPRIADTATRHDDIHTAAVLALDHIYPYSIGKGLEMGNYICRESSQKYRWGIFRIGRPTELSLANPDCFDAQEVGFTHTHVFNESVEWETRIDFQNWAKEPSGYHSESIYDSCRMREGVMVCSGSDLKIADLKRNLVFYLLAPNGSSGSHFLHWQGLPGVPAKTNIWEFDPLRNLWRPYPNAPW